MANTYIWLVYRRATGGDKPVRASKTDTFIIGNGLRVHKYQIARTRALTAEQRGCQPIK